MPDQHTPAEIAVAFIEAFGRGDMDGVAARLAEDVVFTSPQVRLAGAGAVLAAVGEFARAVDGVDIVAVVGDGEQAMIMYDMRTVPFGTLRAVDRLVVSGGRITSDTLVFDTYEVRRAVG